MKTPDKIKKGLEYCSENIDRIDPCQSCPLTDECHWTYESVMTLGVDTIEAMSAELAQVKAERDRYWEYIKGLGCDTCGGDCDRCEVGLDRVWSGWVWAGEKEEERE